jgi:hypothetical protein
MCSWAAFVPALRRSPGRVRSERASRGAAAHEKRTGAGLGLDGSYRRDAVLLIRFPLGKDLFPGKLGRGNPGTLYAMISSIG